MEREELDRLVRNRAGHCCEYCKLPQRYSAMPFQIDHVIARKHGGATVADNLAFACLHCNAFKGPNIAGIDPLTASVTPLFNPRLDRWAEHFQWSGARLIGVTPVGRATIDVLALNDFDTVTSRAELMQEGVFRAEPG